jgi:hypothetical protein
VLSGKASAVSQIKAASSFGLTRLLLALRVARVDACPLSGVNRTPRVHRGIDAIDPTATLAVHCGNGFDVGFRPYQRTHLNP